MQRIYSEVTGTSVEIHQWAVAPITVSAGSRARRSLFMRIAARRLTPGPVILPRAASIRQMNPIRWDRSAMSVKQRQTAKRGAGIEVPPLVLPLAVRVAKAHAEVGLAQFNALQRAISNEANQSDATNLLLRTQHAIPAGTSMALALELFLKICRFQHYGVFPRGHDLVAIVRGLPQSRLELLRQTYTESRASQPIFRAAIYALGLNAPPPKTAIAGSEKPDSFDTALAKANGAYQAWRYFYESLSTKGVTVDFRQLLALIEAAHKGVESHEGNARIALG